MVNNFNNINVFNEYNINGNAIINTVSSWGAGGNNSRNILGEKKLKNALTGEAKQIK